MIDTTPYYVLFADSFTYRHQQIRIRSGTTGRSVHQAHVHTVVETMKSIPTRKWEAVFIAGYFEKHDSIKELIHFMCNLEEDQRPRLVIFHGTTDDMHFVRQLRAVGYIVTHIPWDFMDPSVHQRKDPKEWYPSEEKAGQLLLPAVAERVTN